MNKFIQHILLLLITLSFLFSGNISGQEALSLEQAILKGLENNFQVRISEENLRSAALFNSWGTVGRFPSISVGATNVNRYDDSPIIQSPDIRFETYTNRVSPFVNVNWVLFNGFSVKMNKEKLELLEHYSAGNSAIVVENTVQSIILGYYLVLLEQERERVLKQVKDLSGDRYDYEMIRKELGSAVTFQVLQAKNSFLSDSTNFLLQNLNVKNAFLNLKLLLGERPETNFILTDTFQVQSYDYDIDVLKEKMLSSNKTLKNQYVNQEILRKSTGIAKSGRYPSITMNAGVDYSKNWYNLPEPEHTSTYAFDYYANFTLSFNLFNGGNTKREIENAGIDERIGSIQIQEMTQTLENLLLNQYELYGIRKQLLDVADVNMESAELNMKLATEKYKNGTINSFDFRDVQLIYLNAASKKLNAIYDLIDTHTELMRLTGGIISEY